MGNHKSSGWLAIAVPLLLLAFEVGALTLKVEYVGGPMEMIAHPQMVHAVMIAAVLLLLLRGAALAGVAAPGHRWARIGWLAINLDAFTSLYRLSVALAHPAAESQTASIASALTWIGLVLMVGFSSILVGASWGKLREWISLAWHEAVGSLVLGTALAYLTRDIQQIWHVLWPSTLEISRRLLDVLHPNQALLYPSFAGNPVLGLHGRISLVVTPACAEMESLAVFLLLSTTLLIACWPARLMRWLVATGCGLGLLFLINAVRLALLVELGARFGASWSVHVAHSRFSGMLFLMLGAVWLAITRRWWRGVEPTFGRQSSSIAEIRSP